MKERTESNFYFFNTVNSDNEEVTIEATVRDYRDDSYLPTGQATIDCYEIIKITTPIFTFNFRDSSVYVAGMFTPIVENYLLMKWENIEARITDLYAENYPEGE